MNDSNIKSVNDSNTKKDTQAAEILTSENIMTSYGRWDVTIERGEGSCLYDINGKQYLDFTSGIAVCNFGHCYPPLVRAIQEQATKLWHVSNLFHIPGQQLAANKLVETAGYGKVFFCNSGAEANEAAIKLARRYQQIEKKRDRYEIITFHKSFHGRTLTTITATAQPKYQEGFHPLPAGFVYCPLNDLAAVQAALTDKTAAIMFELIQAEGGIHEVELEFLRGLQAIAAEHDILLIVDEVQTGMGRTGTTFAWQQFDFQPDIFTLAKGLGGGVPIGACIAKEHVAAAFVPGTHASTFGGNPLVCAAAVTVLQELEDAQMQDTIQSNSLDLQQGLQLLQNEFPELIVEVRGRGLLRGAQLVEQLPVAEVLADCRAQGLLLTPAGDNTLRFLPPFNCKASEIEQAFTIIRMVLNTKK